MSGALFLGIVTLVCVGDFFIGMHFTRMANRPIGAPPPVPGASPPEALRKAGRLFMIAAPLFWLFAAAIGFGLIPVNGIAPITFQF